MAILHLDALPPKTTKGTLVRVVTQPGEPARSQRLPHISSPGSRSALHIPLVEGRSFSRDDREETQHVVLINESAARRIFAAEAPLGPKLKCWGPWEWGLKGRSWGRCL